MYDSKLVIQFKSKSITFHPLTVKHIRTMPDEVAALMTRGTSVFDPERFSKLLKLYTVSAQREDSSLTEADVEGIVDLGNISRINSVLLGQDHSAKDANVEKTEETANHPISPLTGGESTTA